MKKVEKFLEGLYESYLHRWGGAERRENEKKGVIDMKKVEKFLEGLYESYLHR